MVASRICREPRLKEDYLRCIHILLWGGTWRSLLLYLFNLLLLHLIHTSQLNMNPQNTTICRCIRRYKKRRRHCCCQGAETRKRRRFRRKNQSMFRMKVWAKSSSVTTITDPLPSSPTRLTLKLLASHHRHLHKYRKRTLRKRTKSFLNKSIF